MKIVNDNLTASLRKPGRCRWCGSAVAMLCGHHLFAKGHGGGRQIDIPCNLISLGATPFDCDCHSSHHDGNVPTFEDLLTVSAADHNCLQSDIESLIHLIQRMPPIRDVTEAIFVRTVKKELGFSARRLALRELVSFRHLLREA